MQSTESVIHVMQTLGEKRSKLTRVYRQMYNKNLYISAYSKLYRNKGALTPGVTKETVDGMNLSRIETIVEQMRRETYRWSPVKRRYITRKDGRKRPLGLPTWGDKLIEEVLRRMLEAYYEPQFSENSHGFRPNRGCHTALRQIANNWTGTVWFIEGDIKSCFDHIDHKKLMAILGKQIDDPRLLRLIRHRLSSGIVEDWVYQRTYSGTPQGGVLSPLLANIYLNELDQYIENSLLPIWNAEKKRKYNPAYSTVHRHLSRARRRKDWKQYKQLTQEKRRIPSQDMYDPDFRRLKYVRYADDFLLAFVGTKDEARQILTQIEEFLGQNLGFQTSESKSRITHAKSDTAKFLGYGISVYGNISDRITGARRSANGRVVLKLPEGICESKEREWKRNGHPRIKGQMLAYSVEETISSYQVQYRGLVNYYQYAVDVHELARVKYAMEQSLAHTLAGKLKISVSQVYRRYSTNIVVNGQKYKVLQSVVEDEKTGRKYTATWGGIPLKRVRVVGNLLEDKVSYGYQARSELVQRMFANKCELCGKETRELEGHHTNQLQDYIRRKRAGRSLKVWESQMVLRRRKTLFVCKPCHVKIHTKNQ